MLKKLKLFHLWKKNIKPLKFELNQKFAARIDNAQRIYTVINVPEELIGEAFSLKKSDIDRISENYVRQYYVELGNFLNKNGCQELFDLYEIQKVDKYSYLLVIGYKLFRSTSYYNVLYYLVSPLIILSTIISLILIL